MTSINFNASATTALRTLQATNNALETSQGRVSTGLKIGEAKDNAAYWSISTTMKSDNQAMATVSDALGLGAGTVDTAYQALNSSITVLNEIKSKLTAATQAGVDRIAIQSEIAELQKQLVSISSSANFSGENWLSPAATAVKSVVASFSRDSSDNVTLGTINFDTSKSALFVGGAGGILQTDSVYGNTTSSALTIATLEFDESADFYEFSVQLGTEPAQLLRINQTAVRAVGNGDTTINGAAEFVSVVSNLISANSSLSGKVTVAKDPLANTIIFTSAKAVTLGTGTLAAAGDTLTDLTATNIAMAAGTAATLTGSVMDIDVATASSAVITGFLGLVNKALDQVTDAASSLGAVSKRIELQQTFVKTLMDTIDKGVSGLVDADLSEESTRLQALQTKQQLGIQALSIANTSTQNVLSLFRS